MHTRVFSRKPKEQPSSDILFGPRAIDVENGQIDNQDEVTKMLNVITKRLEKIEKHIELKK